ncbi:MAG: hypothetical protein FJY75_04185 [Candidatus Eisenbacteria bacterium]|uniref:Outer membrane lipoprotein-sorting protein n=1 Tax=Eiseniibacteriota bacterium TaxID=2212470 RepID=A0A937XA40_UNCEI|nr:hypothetical protein [Candidatus Eisenbacteria bacterium]
MMAGVAPSVCVAALLCRLLLPAGGPAASGQAAPEEILDALFRRLEQRDRHCRGAVYQADYRYQERNRGGELLREESCRRRIRLRDEGPEIEFLSVKVNQEELAGSDREGQIAKLLRRGLVQDAARMPFFPGTRDAYEYELAGEDTHAGREVWVVRFAPRSEEAQAVVGRAFVDKESCDLIGLEFSPVHLPRSCVGALMRLHFATQQGWMLPDRLEMDLDIRVKWLVTLAHRRLRIEDRYSDYRFAAGHARSPGGR